MDTQHTTEKTTSANAGDLARRAQDQKHESTTHEEVHKTEETHTTDEHDHKSSGILKAATCGLSEKLKKMKRKKKEKKEGERTSSESSSSDDAEEALRIKQEEERLMTPERNAGPNFNGGTGFAMKKETTHHEEGKDGEQRKVTETHKEDRDGRGAEHKTTTETHREGRDGRPDEHKVEKRETEVKKPTDMHAETKQVTNEGNKKVEKSYADTGMHTFEAEKADKGKSHGVEEKTTTEHKTTTHGAGPTGGHRETKETTTHREEGNRGDFVKGEYKPIPSEAELKKDKKFQQDIQKDKEVQRAFDKDGGKDESKHDEQDESSRHESRREVHTEKRTTDGDRDRQVSRETHIHEEPGQNSVKTTTSRETTHREPSSGGQHHHHHSGQGPDAEYGTGTDKGKGALKADGRVDETLGDQYAERNIQDMNAKYVNTTGAKAKNEARSAQDDRDEHRDEGAPSGREKPRDDQHRLGANSGRDHDEVASNRDLPRTPENERRRETSTRHEEESRMDSGGRDQEHQHRSSHRDEQVHAGALGNQEQVTKNNGDRDHDRGGNRSTGIHRSSDGKGDQDNSDRRRDQGRSDDGQRREESQRHMSGGQTERGTNQRTDDDGQARNAEGFITAKDNQENRRANTELTREQIEEEENKATNILRRVGMKPGSESYEMRDQGDDRQHQHQHQHRRQPDSKGDDTEFHIDPRDPKWTHTTGIDNDQMRMGGGFPGTGGQTQGMVREGLGQTGGGHSHGSQGQADMEPRREEVHRVEEYRTTGNNNQQQRMDEGFVDPNHGMMRENRAQMGSHVHKNQGETYQREPDSGLLLQGNLAQGQHQHGGPTDMGGRRDMDPMMRGDTKPRADPRQCNEIAYEAYGAPTTQVNQPMQQHQHQQMHGDQRPTPEHQHQMQGQQNQGQQDSYGIQQGHVHQARQTFQGTQQVHQLERQAAPGGNQSPLAGNSPDPSGLLVARDQQQPMMGQGQQHGQQQRQYGTMDQDRRDQRQYQPVQHQHQGQQQFQSSDRDQYQGQRQYQPDHQHQDQQRQYHGDQSTNQATRGNDQLESMERGIERRTHQIQIGDRDGTDRHSEGENRGMTQGHDQSGMNREGRNANLEQQQRQTADGNVHHKMDVWTADGKIGETDEQGRVITAQGGQRQMSGQQHQQMRGEQRQMSEHQHTTQGHQQHQQQQMRGDQRQVSEHQHTTGDQRQPSQHQHHSHSSEHQYQSSGNQNQRMSHGDQQQMSAGHPQQAAIGHQQQQHQHTTGAQGQQQHQQHQHQTGEPDERERENRLRAMGAGIHNPPMLGNSDSGYEGDVSSAETDGRQKEDGAQHQHHHHHLLHHHHHHHGQEDKQEERHEQQQQGQGEHRDYYHDENGLPERNDTDRSRQVLESDHRPIGAFHKHPVDDEGEAGGNKTTEQNRGDTSGRVDIRRTSCERQEAQKLGQDQRPPNVGLSH